MKPPRPGAGPRGWRRTRERIRRAGPGVDGRRAAEARHGPAASAAPEQGDAAAVLQQAAQGRRQVRHGQLHGDHQDRQDRGGDAGVAGHSGRTGQLRDARAGRQHRPSGRVPDEAGVRPQAVPHPQRLPLGERGHRPAQPAAARPAGGVRPEARGASGRGLHRPVRAGGGVLLVQLESWRS